MFLTDRLAWEGQEAEALEQGVVALGQGVVALTVVVDDCHYYSYTYHPFFPSA